MELNRILHVHSGNLYGGVETILMTLARRQGDCPHLQQQFALCFQGRLSRELAGLGAPVHSIGSVRVSRPLTVFRARRELRKLLAEQEFDTLMFHSAWSHAIFAPVARGGTEADCSVDARNNGWQTLDGAVGPEVGSGPGRLQ